MAPRTNDELIEDLEESNDRMTGKLNEILKLTATVQQRLDTLEDRIDEAEEKIENNTRIRYVAVGVGIAIGALAGVVASVMLV